MQTYQLLGPDGQPIKLLTLDPTPKTPAPTDILTLFKMKADSPRGRFLAALHANLGKAVPMDDLASAAFGANTTENFNKLGCLLAGMKWRVKEDGLAFTFQVSKGTITMRPIAQPFRFH